MLRERPPTVRHWPSTLTHILPAMLMNAVLLCLHLLAATFWVGGMAALHFAVRPSLATLEPPVRLPFVSLVLGRFLNALWLAIAVLLASGLVLVARLGGFGGVHWSVHAMFGMALAMIAIFAYVRFGPFAQLRRAAKAGDWKTAAAGLAAVRQLVFVNLLIGTLVYIIAIVGRQG